jgi:SAM-dependent methyltransferase
MSAMPNTTAPGALPAWEARYRRKRGHRGRGLADLEARAGPLRAEIDARLRDREVVDVLELGCGYAIALLDLAARYGPRVRTWGVNLRAEPGQDAILRSEAARRGLDVQARPDALPSLAHGDVARGLPFPDGRFDVVVSQVAWRYFGNKVGVLREVVRVLRDDGVGLIDADEFDAKLPAEYGRLVEIWETGRIVAFGDYLARHGMAFAPTPNGRALRIVKARGFGDDLVRCVEIDTAAIDPRFDGIKCVYRRGVAGAG